MTALAEIARVQARLDGLITSMKRDQAQAYQSLCDMTITDLFDLSSITRPLKELSSRADVELIKMDAYGFPTLEKAASDSVDDEIETLTLHLQALHHAREISKNGSLIYAMEKAIDELTVEVEAQTGSKTDEERLILSRTKAHLAQSSKKLAEFKDRLAKDVTPPQLAKKEARAEVSHPLTDGSAAPAKTLEEDEAWERMIANFPSLFLK